MKILAIETSCDDTAIAVLETIGKDKIRVLSNVVSSQVKLHAKYGGVFPRLAAREHTKNIDKVFKMALKEAGLKSASEVDLIAVTRGPGLIVSLLVGITFAKTLAWKYKKPLVGVNHLEGHIHSNWLKPIREIFSLQEISRRETKIFPALCLVVSGGHTELVLMDKVGQYKIIGATQDDAVGEAFDKVARLLDLGYPGGPAIAQRAEQWNFQFPISNFQSKAENTKDQILKIEFPRPMVKSKNYNFSFSGLKTAVLYRIRGLKEIGIKINDPVINKICYEFQKAAVDVLVTKTLIAAKEYKVKSILLSGGVSANKLLREELEKKISNELPKVKFLKPNLAYTTDNAAMIGLAGYLNYKSKEDHPWDSVQADANLSL